MEGKQLEEALDHDQARKEAEAASQTPPELQRPPTNNQEVSAALRAIDERYAMAAKSLGCVLLSRVLTMAQDADATSDNISAMKEMVSLAGYCDTLGDKALLK